MLKEFVEALAKQAIEAAAPQIKETDPTKTYAVRNPTTGLVDFIGGRVPWRKHKAQDLETVVAFAERFETAAATGTSIGATIWYNRDKIVCLTNDAERFDRVTVDMLKSKQILSLVELDAKRPLMPQRDFLFMLRTVFTPNAFPIAPKLIDMLRQVKFEAGAKSEGNIQRGKTSVGKEVTAAATFLDAVPEQVTLSVPVFDNSFMPKSYDVICALEIYEQEQRLQLFPLPGEIESAFAHAEADLCKSLRDLLGKTTVPVYYGCP
jgi:hypothetical protein